MTCQAVRLLTMAACAAGTFLMGVTQSRADVVTFALSGTFTASNTTFGTMPLSGNLTIDTTTGIVTSQSIFPQPPYSGISIVQRYDAVAQAYLVQVGVLPGIVDYDGLYFNASSLVGYTGGNLGSTATPTPTGRVSIAAFQQVGLYTLTSGTATPLATPMPEPTTAKLLLVGLAGLGVTLFRRHGRSFGY